VTPARPLAWYADSSFLISLHTNDANAGAARRFMARSPAPLAFNPLHRLEVFNGLRLAVFRGEMTREERAQAMRQIEEDLADGILVHQAMPWTDALRKAEHLSAAHAEQTGSRSADTLHVAAAMLAGARRFLSFDQRQRDLARAAGLTVKP
jgi:predicted nucleic acid-binding protein